MILRIHTSVTESGFTLRINKTPYTFSYPSPVWKHFPVQIKVTYAEFISFMVTVHNSFNESVKIQYNFPTPLLASWFYHGLILSQPENILDFEEKGKKTSEFVKQVVNSFHHITFRGFARLNSPTTYKYKPKTAIVPFTFGKDSLLTYGLCRKLSVTPIPIFFLEPTNKNENEIKEKLQNQFFEEFGEKIITIPVPFAQLKQNKGFWWGWDIFLTQYTMFLLPYLYYYKPEYFLWSNEQDCNEIVADDEGFLVNPTFEQGASWMHQMNVGLRLFGVSTKLGSLLEPVSELAILTLLHTYFPQLARYQASCLNDISYGKRWCGKCYECARVYISLLASGRNPESVGFDESMLTKKKKKLFYIFEKETDLHTRFHYVHDQKEFAFYLAMKRGVSGDLMDVFRKRLSKKVIPNIKKYKKLYLYAQPSYTVPEELKKDLYEWYQYNLNSVSNQLD